MDGSGELDEEELAELLRKLWKQLGLRPSGEMRMQLAEVGQGVGVGMRTGCGSRDEGMGRPTLPAPQ